MKNNKNYVLSANIDEKMNAIVSKIKDEIRMDMYPIKDSNSFVETAILVMYKMMENDISPYTFDSFIESYRRDDVNHSKFDAKKKPDSHQANFNWCPAAESNYGLNLTMVPLYRLTSGATAAFLQRK